ncbi:hypothetical protein DVR12_15120 [Chitinophaga silvatica]|uniref:Uncharacterized protein n=1 Tax=Chitinophaga silvatica TaxID=2282649 RepID=A0A3E1Y993_9BACT|nr:hypothetical protein DVR12_15120 [Chitinophaga silvatica]
MENVKKNFQHNYFNINQSKNILKNIITTQVHCVHAFAYLHCQRIKTLANKIQVNFYLLHLGKIVKGLSG